MKLGCCLKICFTVSHQRRRLPRIKKRMNSDCVGLTAGACSKGIVSDRLLHGGRGGDPSHSLARPLFGSVPPSIMAEQHAALRLHVEKRRAETLLGIS